MSLRDETGLNRLLSALFVATHEPSTQALWLPLKTTSEANRREHWTRKAARVSRQREAVAAMLGRLWRLRPEEDAIVAMTLHRPRDLDDDNRVSACKALRDEVAKALGVDDREPRVVWLPPQWCRCKRGGDGVDIRLWRLSPAHRP